MRPSFKKKLDYSIALLQRMEKLALRYDVEHGFWLAFSGGKDSQALYHVAQMAGVRFKAFMSLTSVDPPQVIRFVKRYYPDVERIKPKASIFDLAVEKTLLPSMRVRWCCAELKENAKPQTVTLIGIRRAESARRAKRNDVEVSGHKFSGDADGFDAWQEKQMKKKLKNLNIDEFSIQNESMVKCVGGKDSILVSPIIDWTEQDVWYFLNEVCHVPHCELYDAPFNMHRIGCILCPMSNRKQKEREMQLWPHVKRGWIDAIMRIRRGEGGGNSGLTQILQSRKLAGYIQTSKKHWMPDGSSPKATCGGTSQPPSCRCREQVGRRTNFTRGVGYNFFLGDRYGVFGYALSYNRR